MGQRAVVLQQAEELPGGGLNLTENQWGRQPGRVRSRCAVARGVSLPTAVCVIAVALVLVE